MTEMYELGDRNAPRQCDECGKSAIVYVHEVGFRCGDCFATERA